MSYRVTFAYPKHMTFCHYFTYTPGVFCAPVLRGLYPMVNLVDWRLRTPTPYGI